MQVHNFIYHQNYQNFLRETNPQLFSHLLPIVFFICSGIASLLPPNVLTIRNKEGVHGAISFCFRPTQGPYMPTIKNEKTSDEIDLAFEALKKLNLYGQKLTERYNQRIKNSSPEVYSKVVFNIGQVVVHKESSCRCVVTGMWSHIHFLFVTLYPLFFYLHPTCIGLLL